MLGLLIYNQQQDNFDQAFFLLSQHEEKDSQFRGLSGFIFNGFPLKFLISFHLRWKQFLKLGQHLSAIRHDEKENWRRFMFVSLVAIHFFFHSSVSFQTFCCTEFIMIYKKTRKKAVSCKSKS